MKLIFPAEVQDLIRLIKNESKSARELYLVGGAVRDALLGRKSKDLDFATEKDPTELARRIAKCLGVGFFMLDDPRHTARVMYRNPDGRLSPIDFVQYTGKTLEEDLENRDFTINAIALLIDDLNDVIDPLDGRSALKSRLLIPCSDHALNDDPVRLFRAIRLSHQLGFQYAPELPEMMRSAAAGLSKSSAERKRDEFVKILSGEKLKQSLADCYRFGVFEAFLPQIYDQEDISATGPHAHPVLDQKFQAVENLDKIIRYFAPKVEAASEKTDWWLEAAFIEMQPFSDAIMLYFNAEITPGRSKHCLTLLSALLQDVGKPSMKKNGRGEPLVCDDLEVVRAEIAREVARSIKLSNAESVWIQTIVYHHRALLQLIQAQGTPDRRSIYRYFQKTGDAGVAIAFLSLAEKAATYMDNLNCEQWKLQLMVTKTLLSAWWEEREVVVSPIPFLNGKELQKEFGLEPGLLIGQLLDELIEAQASGILMTKEDARVFVRGRMTDLLVNDEPD